VPLQTTKTATRSPRLSDPGRSKSVAIQIIEGEFARAPLSIVNAIGSALDATLPVFVEKRVRVLYQKPQADGPHFVLELKLHMELDRVTAKSDVVRWIVLVSKGQLEAKLLGVELDRPLDVPRAENRVGFFEHCNSETHDRGRCAHTDGNFSRNLVAKKPLANLKMDF